ncbi:unnamed protein product [Microthlaspi erraticum]|uniref:MULE transposase domain-containing protein n=1 Tax=Microthlaspi erraticum TaxID=1685480 RepID=A0A6D2KD75_9BRAS|nr:unnamed protein product [Microthlaspi erraticum]
MVDKEDEAVNTRALIKKGFFGTWTRGDSKGWIFEPDKVDVTGSIRLHSGLSYCELVGNVRRSLQILDPSIKLKLAYQYPQWMAIDDGDGSTPQYITDDQEVEVFIQMRRHIEEVNLCVTVSKNISGIPTAVEVGIITEREGNDGGNDEGAEANTEWYEFAMSETPMTMPSQALGSVNPTCHPLAVPKRRRPTCISIREAEPIIRLASPAVSRGDKGKGIAVEEVTDSDSDDDAIVPVLQADRQQSVGEVASSGGVDAGVPVLAADRPPSVMEGASSGGVRRRLFPDAHSCEDAASDSDEGGDDIDDEVPLGERQTWGRFEEALHQLLTDFSTEASLFGRDVPPVFEADLDDVDSALADVPYEGDKLYIGRVYKSKTDCKIKIAIHAINRRFHFRTTRSMREFMLMQCASLTCGWRVYTVLLDGSGNFQIRSANLFHTCNVDDRRNYHRLATTQVIGEIMQSKFIGIKRGPTPAGIMKVMLDDYHVNVSYWKAWRSREIAMDTALGTMAGSYALLPAYLALLQNANPGTQCYLEHEENPDGGRYGGCLLSACTQDANFQIFTLAFGVVDSENDDSWIWFLNKLTTFVDDSIDLVFVTDRHQSIYTGLATVYPQAHHVACTVHLWRNVRGSYKPRRIATIMSDAARQFNVEGFNKKFIEIQKLNPGCAAYLVDIGFDHWTRAHCKGRRFNIMDSNIAESWNAVVKEAREYPLICMFEYIRTSVMSWFAMRRAKAMKNDGLLSPHVKKLIAKKFEESTDLAVRMISEFEFQI